MVKCILTIYHCSVSERTNGIAVIKIYSRWLLVSTPYTSKSKPKSTQFSDLGRTFCQTNPKTNPTNTIQLTMREILFNTHHIQALCTNAKIASVSLLLPPNTSIVEQGIKIARPLGMHAHEANYNPARENTLVCVCVCSFEMEALNGKNILLHKIKKN